MSVDTDRPPTAGAAPCPCRRGDVAAEVARQRPLLERAARGDRESFARLYLMQVDGVYRYLLAWTGERAAAKELTEQVFRAALAWLPITAGGEAGAGAPGAGAAGAGAPHADADLGAWLVALARDAVAQWREAGGWPGRSSPPTGGRHPRTRWRRRRGSATRSGRWWWWWWCCGCCSATPWPIPRSSPATACGPSPSSSSPRAWPSGS